MKTRHPRGPTYLAVITWLLLSAGVNDLRAQGTAFAFQGRLSDNGSPANGEYDLNCSLFDAATSGTQIGFSVTNAPLSVSNGLFTTLLDFGSSAFSGPARWLQIAVRTNGSAGAYTTLLPRPPISAVPYSITAGNLTGPVADAQLSSNIPRLNASQAFSGELSASSFAGSGAGLTGLNASQLSSGTVPTAALGNAWQLGGNSGTAPGANFVGTTDDQAFELKVNGVRALRLEPNSTSPNLVGGWFGNSVYPGLNGVTISGGGQDGYGLTNQATAGADNSVIGGGYGNTASAANVTIGGGAQNTASGQYATVPGGVANTAAGFTSFAAGRQAKASHDGAFVWADSAAEDFASTSNNQFLIRASGGGGIGKNNPPGG